MRLVQARIVTDDVAGLAAFYAGLLQADVALNDYYVEVPAGPASVGFSKRRFTEYRAGCAAGSAAREVILDFQAADADAEYPRIAALGVDWLMPPATQPWGSRSMIFRDPEGTLVNVFSRGEGGHLC
jgi:predicted enzyme related to lactoylglutathione lyase